MWKIQKNIIAIFASNKLHYFRAVSYLLYIDILMKWNILRYYFAQVYEQQRYFNFYVIYVKDN